ncbi:MAG: M67 family peptidase [Dehalococcoidia bacterium]|nr:M67 family peptidase [Dehalococcoidia bacterium]
MFRIEKKFADEMIAHAIEDAPNECCGIIAGKDGKVTQVYRAINAHLSPYSYTIDTKDLLRIDGEISDREWEWIGIYHSHTFTEAYPSATDINLAFLPNLLYFLVSLRDSSSPDLRAFHIFREDGTVTEEPLAIFE